MHRYGRCQHHSGYVKEFGGLNNAGRNAVLTALFGDPDDDSDEGLWSPTIPPNRLRQMAASAPSRASIARQYGSDVHGAIESWLKYSLGLGPEPFLEPELYKPARQVVEWLDKNEWLVLDVEATVYHPSGAYAGTADCIAFRGDTTAIFDWKTGGDIWPESALQIAGYATAYETITGLEVTEGYVLRSNSDGLEAKRVADFAAAKRLFGGIVELRKKASDEVGATEFVPT